MESNRNIDGVTERIVVISEQRAHSRSRDGTGKMFLLNCILAYMSQRNDVALAVAGSGIAATLLKLGRTAHSRFKLPIPVDADSTCNITPRSTTAELIRHTKLQIVWDEAPMSV